MDSSLSNIRGDGESRGGGDSAGRSILYYHQDEFIEGSGFGSGRSSESGEGTQFGQGEGYGWIWGFEYGDL